MTCVFVYGTLKRGCRNHQFLGGQQFLGEARTPPGFTLYSLGPYPGMARDNSDTAGVTGEVWAVDANSLEKLDELEGVNQGLYERVPVKLLPPFADESVETYLYLRSLTGRTLLGSDWVE